MSKIELKKELQKLTKEQLIEQITELYSMYKPVKEHYKIFLNPNNMQDLFEQYKAIIVNKFNPARIAWNIRTCFPAAKKAIKEFSALKPPPKLLADLWITLVENACDLTDQYGDMPEQHYDNTMDCFEKALTYMKKVGLLNDFKPRCKKCLKDAIKCGGGFSDGMSDVYYEYFEK
ncbi:MAG: DUF6155 family protein [Tannerella sp.]|jgi:hypothetical protein|nr:DUF6155 family protein [Tannerella sp.]